MNLTVKTLDLLFRRMSPEKIITDICSGRIWTQDWNAHYRDLFLSKAEDTLHGYSFEEQENIFNYAFQAVRKYGENQKNPPFFLLVDCGEQYLEQGPNGPLCKFDKALDWRDAYLLLGQDMITTAFLAYRAEQQNETSYFSWPAVIPADNHILDGIVSNLAENHLHLYAGASTFAITWCCVMNHPETILQNRVWMKKLLERRTSRGSDDNMWTMERRLLYAVFLRCRLFEKLHGISAKAGCANNAAPLNKLPLTLREFHRGYGFDQHECRKLEWKISCLRWRHGLETALPNGQSARLDYALTQELHAEAESDLRLLAAERFFLFSCFQKCFSAAFSPEDQWSFYCYLLLKTQIRSEFIQINRQVGFHNFHDYDSRKYQLWKGNTEYWYEDYRQAINASFHEQRIGVLEGRVSPQKTARKNITALHAIDQAKLFFDTQSQVERERIKNWRASYLMNNEVVREPYYFVLHFPKVKDSSYASHSAGKYRPRCRHEDYRNRIRRTAIELAMALSNSDYLSQRVLGIDACSNEIVCRPEVLAGTFRFLRHFAVKHFRVFPFANSMPQLHATFHVGEDFLDIADGLRAMDEAVNFLDFQRGDRFGHALALGVDPTVHYSLKNRTVILTKQELLDNLVWLCYRSVELNVEINLLLKNKLKSRAQALFDEIYLDDYSGLLGDGRVSLEDYYHSMLLRGDAPACYKTGSFQPRAPKSPYDFYQLNERQELLPQLSQYRRQKATATLYFLYHYGIKAKQVGAELTTFDVQTEYVYLIRQMQQAMQEYVNALGISIECNPSSNVLIGTFQQYQKHPIFCFNHDGLNGSDRGPQMHVSVNSDDPGVFDTSLTFEYTLLAATLTEMTDEMGKRIHTDREIEHYLRTLVRMGQEQSFYHSQIKERSGLFSNPINRISTGKAYEP